MSFIPRPRILFYIALGLAVATWGGSLFIFYFLFKRPYDSAGLSANLLRAVGKTQRHTTRLQGGYVKLVDSSARRTACLIAGVAFALAGLAGCDPNAAIISKAEAEVRAKFRDPDSAVFKDVRVYSEGVVCGSVNAKNAYGAMVGFKDFVYGGRFSSLADIGKDAEQMSEFCSNETGKLLAFKRRELKSFQLQCLEPNNYEYSCTRADELLSEIAAEEKRGGVVTAPGAASAPSAPATAMAPVALFGQVVLDAVVDKYQPCPTKENESSAFPCVRHGAANKAEPTKYYVKLDPKQLPTWAHDSSFTVTRDKASRRITILFAFLDMNDRDEAREVVAALRQRFGTPHYMYSGEIADHARWDWPDIYVDASCSAKYCMLLFETPTARRESVEAILAKRIKTTPRPLTP